MNKNSIILLAIMLAATCSCWEGMKQKKITPNEYLNHTIISAENYTADSVQISKQLKSYVLAYRDFFNNSAYCDSTELIIDSILYSPGFNKIAAFLITKNPVDRQLIPNYHYKWYYDATCYLGIRQKDSIELYWIGPSFTNSYNRDELNNITRNSYFTDFATKDTSGPYIYKYNLNDSRFWDCSIWREIK